MADGGLQHITDLVPDFTENCLFEVLSHLFGQPERNQETHAKKVKETVQKRVVIS
jgi:hypothetical protein